MLTLLRSMIYHVSIEQVLDGIQGCGPVALANDPCPGLQPRSINLRFSAQNSTRLRSLPRLVESSNLRLELLSLLFFHSLLASS
jgi:hypothetical protein